MIEFIQNCVWQVILFLYRLLQEWLTELRVLRLVWAYNWVGEWLILYGYHMDISPSIQMADIKELYRR